MNVGEQLRRLLSETTGAPWRSIRVRVIQGRSRHINTVNVLAVQLPGRPWEVLRDRAFRRREMFAWALRRLAQLPAGRDGLP